MCSVARIYETFAQSEAANNAQSRAPDGSILNCGTACPTTGKGNHEESIDSEEMDEIRSNTVGIRRIASRGYPEIPENFRPMFLENRMLMHENFISVRAPIGKQSRRNAHESLSPKSS